MGIYVYKWVYMGVYGMCKELLGVSQHLDASSRTIGVWVYMGVYGCIWDVQELSEVSH